MNKIILMISGVTQLLTMCLCNIATFIYGLITLEYIIAVNIHTKQNNTELVQDKLKTAQYINIMGWIWFIISWLVRIKIMRLGQ